MEIIFTDKKTSWNKRKINNVVFGWKTELVRKNECNEGNNTSTAKNNKIRIQCSSLLTLREVNVINTVCDKNGNQDPSCQFREINFDLSRR